MDLFVRTHHPILEPASHPAWASGAVFNPGAWRDNDIVHLLFRAIPEGYRRISVHDMPPGEAPSGYDNYVSSIGYATSLDGVRFEWMDQPFVKPDNPFDRYGAEDPRISRIDDLYLITYTALSHPAYSDTDGVRIGLATTRDWKKVEKHGTIGPDRRDKDAVIFPRRIGGRVAMLHRIHPDIQLIWFDDLDQLLSPPAQIWEEHLERLEEHVVLRPAAAWESRKVGAGPTPIETTEGWLLIYHGVDEQHCYRAGLALLDLDDPLRVIARTHRPVLQPETDFERFGDVNNVVFPQGAVIIDGTLHLYYGGADRVVGHATASMDDLLACLHEERVRSATSKTISTPPPVTPYRMFGGHPVLEPDPSHPWESRVVLNPAAIFISSGNELDTLCSEWDLPEQDRLRLRDAGGVCVMLYRAQGEKDEQKQHAPSSLGLAFFTPDLRLVYRHPEPVIRPEASFHNLGVEDPRITRIGDTYFLYYTGYAEERPGGPPEERKIRICLATTHDFREWKLHGPVAGDLNRVPNKNAALFPQQVDGRWLLLHRPMEGPDAMAIHLAESDNPGGPWNSLGLLMKSHVYREFERSWIGAGGPPIALGDNRFLMIFHQGHFTTEGSREYDLAAALLDFDEHPPVRARIEPLMRPSGRYEQQGDENLGVDNVLFTCANYLMGEQLIIPYAGADSRIFGARIALRELMDALEAIGNTRKQ